MQRMHVNGNGLGFFSFNPITGVSLADVSRDERTKKIMDSLYGLGIQVDGNITSVLNVADVKKHHFDGRGNIKPNFDSASNAPLGTIDVHFTGFDSFNFDPMTGISLQNMPTGERHGQVVASLSRYGIKVTDNSQKIDMSAIPEQHNLMVDPEDARL